MQILIVEIANQNNDCRLRVRIPGEGSSITSEEPWELIKKDTFAWMICFLELFFWKLTKPFIWMKLICVATADYLRHKRV